jgi:cell wall-associated NlpC family hydrolase
MAGAAVLMAGGLAAGITQAAGAQPSPSISQVEARINALTGEYNKAEQQYAVVAAELTAARGRLAQVDRQMASAQRAYDSSKLKVARIADASFEDSGQASLAGLLTSGNPQDVLNEASMILELTDASNMQTRQFLADARQLAAVRREQQRTELGIAQLAAQQARTKNSFLADLQGEKAQLDSLQSAAARQQAQQATMSGSASSAVTATTAVPAGTASQAAKAVSFVLQMAADHCPYTWGATGPCSVGFDCSGLVMSAWASAGVSIPRDTYEQWAALPHIPMSALQPGDLLYYNGESHVAMYVGNGYIVDAPQPGMTVEEIPEDTSWYAQNLDGAVQP